MPAKKTSRKTAPKKASKTAPKKASRPTVSMTPKLRPGMASHTELVSASPPATKAWCSKVLGWKFEKPMPIPGGEYHMWRHESGTGGGIRAPNPPEQPGTIPYVEVPSIKPAYAKALENGAREMLPPMEIPNSMGFIAVVQAPGGVPIGFWSTK